MIVRIRIRRLAIDNRVGIGPWQTRQAIGHEFQHASGDPAHWSAKGLAQQLGTAIGRETHSGVPDV